MELLAMILIYACIGMALFLVIVAVMWCVAKMIELIGFFPTMILLLLGGC